MFVTTVPNRGSPPAVLLRESYREDGKVKSRTLANLSHWPDEKIQTLRAALRGDRLVPAGEGGFEIRRSLPHGHVLAALATARRIGLDDLPPPPNSPPPACSIPPRPAIPSARLWASAPFGCARSTPPSTGWALSRASSRTASPAATSRKAHWYSTTSLRLILREATARSPITATAGTSGATGRNWSSGCCVPLTAVPSRSRCSKATPPIPPPWPARSPN